MATKPIRKLVLAAAFCAALTAGAYKVMAYCYEGPMPNYDIPVHIVHDSSTFLGYPTADVAEDLRVALDSWMEDGGTNIRPYYAGWLTSATLQAGQVHVRVTDQCDKCTRSACEKTVYIPPLFGQRASTIYLVTARCNGQPYEWFRHSDELASFDATFTHEFGHSLGIEDEYLDDNGDPLCDGDSNLMSAMSGKCPNGRNITHRDVGSLEGLYGMRNKTYKTRVSTDGGLTWVAGPADTTPLRAWVRQTSLGTTAALATAESLAEAMFGQYIGGAPPYTHEWHGSTGGSFSMNSVWGANNSESYDAAGAARASSSNRAVAFRTDEDDHDCSKMMHVVRIDGADEQVRGAKINSTDFFTSYSEGASVAYDPRTNFYIAAAVDDSNRIGYQLINAASGNRVGYNVFSTNIGGMTFKAPSVACNEVAYGGAYNCIVAWRAAEARYPVRYNRFYVTTTPDFFGRFIHFESSSPKLHNYRTSQAPSITWQRDAAYPFVLALKQDTTMYTWRYRASTSSFVDQRTAVSLPNDGILAGALGTQAGRLILRYVQL